MRMSFRLPHMVVLITLLLAVIFQQQPAQAGNPGTEGITAEEALVERVYLPVVQLPSGFDLSVKRVEVIQGVTMSPDFKVHIANRPTTVRVFVNLQGRTSLSNVTARLTRYTNGSPHANPLTAGPTTIYQTPDEGSLLQTLNFTLPAEWTVPGTSYVLELDPGKTHFEKNENNNRYPASGQKSFGFVTVDPMDVVLVPIDYVKNGTHYLPDTSRTDYLSALALKVFPVSTINYSWHAPLTYTKPVLNNGTGWADLLNEVTALHEREDPGRTKLYYGVINIIGANGCANGCVVGIGWLGAPTAVGFSGFGSGEVSASSTMVHEMGHNFNRKHVACQGNESSPDYNYPYPQGGIGVWGLDVIQSKLYSPSMYRDYMSYCNDTWTSDYTYKAIYDFRQSRSFSILGAEAQDTLALSGTFSDDGSVSVLPLYRQTGYVHDTSTGTHSLELTNVRGERIGTFRFTPQEIADLPVQTWGFSLSIPYVEGVAGLQILGQDGTLLYERTLPEQVEVDRSAGPAALAVDGLAAEMQADGSARAAWNRSGVPGEVYRLSFSPDGGQTWQVLALEYEGTDFTVPADLLSGASDPLLEIQAVDGLRTDTQVIPLN